MDADDVRLVEPTEELRSEFLEMAEEWRAEGDVRYDDALKDFDAHLRAIRDASRGLGLAPDRVPYTLFWLTAFGRVVGRSAIRHRLNALLEREGGHIGYDIRPSERRKGYGTLILRLTLERARALGLTRVLVTCDTDNTASARIIEKNGGVFDSHAVSERTGKTISRYWIEIKDEG
ncbi:MAG TPA: GNAT family N-acetyltransferase [Pyrinomonadaceae bacterium]|nr:GNAT family N-acetyltransferase [Pyrinomonadaceae bacterium]